MLSEVADDVLVHRSALIQNTTTVVVGRAGALVVDPGLTDAELTCLADDLARRGLPVVAGFSTHPDWDHVLWHPALGDATRWATAAGTAAMRELRADEAWRDRAVAMLPPEIADDVPLGPFGLLTPLPTGTRRLPWDGPPVRVLEHPAHSVGHAALLVEEAGVLVAGDMLSDVLVPFPDLEAADPLGDYLVGLALLEGLGDEVRAVVPGHGSVGGAGDLRRRADLDRAYVTALQQGRLPEDPRTRPDAAFGDWLPGISGWQLEQLAGAPGHG